MIRSSSSSSRINRLMRNIRYRWIMGSTRTGASIGTRRPRLLSFRRLYMHSRLSWLICSNRGNNRNIGENSWLPPLEAMDPFHPGLGRVWEERREGR